MSWLSDSKLFYLSLDNNRKSTRLCFSFPFFLHQTTTTKEEKRKHLFFPLIVITVSMWKLSTFKKKGGSIVLEAVAKNLHSKKNQKKRFSSKQKKTQKTLSHLLLLVFSLHNLFYSGIDDVSEFLPFPCVDDPKE